MHPPPLTCCSLCVVQLVADCDAAAARWRAHPVVRRDPHLHIGVFPRGACLTLDLPHDGSLLCYVLAVFKVLPFFLKMVKEEAVRTVTPGVMEVYSPVKERLRWVLPLEERKDLVRWELCDELVG